MGKQILVAAYAWEEGLPEDMSMHLALKKEDAWEVLNFGLGVLFPEAELENGTPAGTTRVLSKPVLYRKENGAIGVNAVVLDAEQTRTGVECSWETTDLVHYTLIKQGEGVEATASDGDNKTACVNGVEKREQTERIRINGTQVEASIIEISEKEAEYLEKKLGETRNVGVKPISIHAKKGEAKPELPGLTAVYSDGSEGMIPVLWDKEAYEKLDVNQAGVYEVTGTADVGDYPSPLMEGIADPMIRLFEGSYYLVGTNEYTEGRDLYIRKADDIMGLKDAEPVRFFKATESGEHSGCNWAPELHVIGGKLCCLFASSLTGEWNAVQSRIMECNGDPMNPEAWSECKRVVKMDGSPLIVDGITLDMTYFEDGGESYYCWAQRDIVGDAIGTSDLYIAKVNPEHADMLASEPVRLLVPMFAWDRQHTTVDEGPNVLKKDGMLYMTFSGDSVSDYYCMGLLTARENTDLLNPASWTLTKYPVLGRQHVEGERGPGHNAFTKDGYGRDILVYHMKPDGGMRSFSARVIHYGFDGEPIFYMTPDRYLREEFRNVTAQIVVEEK